MITPDPALPETEAIRPTQKPKSPPSASSEGSLKWLPLLDAARTICFAPTPEMRLQMQIMRANPLRLARA